jgi:hypothetical protein
VRTADGSPTREREISRLVWRDGRVVRVLERLALDAQSTRVREISAEPMGQSPIRVIAPSEQQPAADAALRAVLRRGLRLPPAGLLEPLTVEWPGDVEHLADVLESRLAASMDAWEPETLQDTTLASLSRAPKVQEDPAPVDAGDRRVVWSIVVGLLVAELWFRQGASWK